MTSIPGTIGFPAREHFHQSLDGKSSSLIILENDFLLVAFTNYGARIVGLWTRDNSGSLRDVVAGFDHIHQYLTTDEKYHGAIIGRYANRIREGRFILDDREYQLNINNGPNHLHGGLKGFHDVIWETDNKQLDRLHFSYSSPSEEENYPGNLTVKVVYSLVENSLHIHYTAETDQATILNLTNHAYFNLNGQGRGDILEHHLQINADSFTPIDENSIPTGEIQPVSNTPFDFRQLTPIGKRIQEMHPQLVNGQGYDHNFVLNTKGDDMNFAARAIGNESGIMLEVETTEPGLQFYSGNFMKGKNLFKGNLPDIYRSAFCLETQHFPDSPNQPTFPSTILRPGQIFNSQTIYRFSVSS